MDITILFPEINLFNSNEVISHPVQPVSSRNRRKIQKKKEKRRMSKGLSSVNPYPPPEMFNPSVEIETKASRSKRRRFKKKESKKWLAGLGKKVLPSSATPLSGLDYPNFDLMVSASSEANKRMDLEQLSSPDGSVIVTGKPKIGCITVRGKH